MEISDSGFKIFNCYNNCKPLKRLDYIIYLLPTHDFGVTIPLEKSWVTKKENVGEPVYWYYYLIKRKLFLQILRSLFPQKSFKLFAELVQFIFHCSNFLSQISNFIFQIIYLCFQTLFLYFYNWSCYFRFSTK